MSRVIFLALAISLSGPSVVTVTYMHTDIFGNLIAETDENRNVVRRYSYEPYGLPRQPIDGPGFTGHNMDDDTALIYMQQRYYDPEVGQFLSVDPVSVDMANAWNFNRYNYAANNPVSNSDPTGAVCVSAYNMSFAMCQRSIRYHSMHGDQSISNRTSFFGAAAMATSAMAAPFPNAFMAELSFTLESANLERAAQIRSGQLYSGGSIEANDRDFVRFEQGIVQDALDSYRADNPSGYDAMIADTNAMLNGYPSRGARISDPNFARALQAARSEIGGDIDFANQSHRESLGDALTNIARQLRRPCTGSLIRQC
jgi:RHS repeat-associated protein